MNAFDKIQLWASLLAVVLIIGGIVVAANNQVGLGIIVVIAGLILAGVGKIAIGARQQAAQNALIRRK